MWISFVEVVRFLTEAHADVYAMDVCKTTPLDLASAKGHLEVVHFLTEADAEGKNHKMMLP